MLTKTFSIFIICLLLFSSCTKEKKKEVINKNTLPKVEKEQEVQKLKDSSKLLFWVHTPDMKVEYFIDKGLIAKDEFINEFQKIDWDKEAEKIVKTFTTNSIRLELIDDLKYLSISVGITGKKGKTKEFLIGYGDITNEKDKKLFSVELYGTGGLDKTKVIELINLFFDKNLDELIPALDRLEYYVYIKKDPHYILETR